MSGDSFYSNCPIVRKETMRFMRLAETARPGVRRMVSFDEAVEWLRKSSSDIVFVHGGKDLKRVSSYSDFYGLMTSIGSAVEEAQSLAGAYSVDSLSSLSIEVRFTLVEEAVHKLPIDSFGSHRPRFEYVDRDWFVFDESLMSKINESLERNAGHDEFYELKSQAKTLWHDDLPAIEDGKVIWSTRMSDNEHHAIVSTLKQLYEFKELSHAA